MKKIYISHEYGGMYENRVKIEKLMRKLINKYPDYVFISPVHCFGFMYSDVSYKRGIEWCLNLLDCCDEIWVCSNNISKGVRLEIEHALNKDIYVKNFEEATNEIN